MSKIIDGKEIRLGVCYYPEHWKEENWKSDIERMQKVGIHCVRIAEFAWSIVERTEGNFTYNLFDRFLDLAESMKMDVIFCTPTATPPAWLTEKYPQVLNADINGTLYRHGSRRHYNYNSPKYRELSSIIVSHYAEHYAKRKCIIGWQIDNEINCELNEFYSESDTEAFRTFLKDKYGTIDNLNEAWGTVFWSQIYTSWDEVYVPRKCPHLAVNPHEVLDYKRFISSSARLFVKMQSDILKKYIKEGDFITTNGIFGNLDSHKMASESLSFITYDSYPNFGYMLDRSVGGYTKGEMNDRKWSRNLSLCRSISPAFGIMEHQTGANGWNCRMVAPSPREGQVTLWTMQSIAHGADYIGYFRWRTAAFGTEMYWHGILDYSGRDNRRLKEIAEINKKINSIQCVAGSRYAASVGILRDYDNEWDSEVDLWHGAIESASSKALFAALECTHTPFDYVNITDETEAVSLAKYKVLFYPHAVIMDEKRVKVLEEYARGGGVLVFGCRGGYKDLSGHCVTENLPALLSPITGADVREYSFIAPDEEEAGVDWGGKKMTAAVFTDLVEPLEGAVIEAKYTSGCYKGCGAMVSKKIGSGKVYYYGAAFNEESASLFLDTLKAASPYSSIVTMPKECEIAVRKKSGEDGGRYAFILNYSKERKAIDFKKEVYSILQGKKLNGEEVLPPYGVEVVKLP